MSTVPTPTPDDYVDAPRRELLDALTAADDVLADFHHGIGAPRTSADVRRAALVALATARALAELLLRWEWIAQVAALRTDAPLAEVAAASGLDVDEVLAGLRSRIAAQVEHDLMPPDAAADLHALIDRAASAPPTPQR